MPYHSRAPRVSVAGARVRLADAIVNLVNVSRTGALVRASHEVSLGSACALTLELKETPVRLSARVVRSEPAAAEFVAGTLRRQFAVALAFIKPSSQARSILHTVCGSGRTPDGLPFTFGRLSFGRHCPRCLSRAVIKASRHRYVCRSCDHTFLGFRLGSVRIAI